LVPLRHRNRPFLQKPCETTTLLKMISEVLMASSTPPLSKTG
jgi:hypothetical protein